jgi:ubiquinone/menaquinone biosynthesis C-methylase UbiE
MREELKARWADDYADDWVTKVLPRLAFVPALLQPEIGRLLGDVRGKAILDAGCGEGVYARYLGDAGAAVVGIDGSAKMIAFAKERAPRLEFRVADLMEPLDFPDRSFDAVVCAGVLMSLPQLDTFLSESRRVLKPQGVLLIAVHHPAFSNPTMTFRQSFWDRMLRRPVQGVAFSYYDRGGTAAAPGSWPFHHRTIEEYVDAFRQHAFQIDRITEPHEIPEQMLADGNLDYVTRLPRYIFFKLLRS